MYARVSFSPVTQYVSILVCRFSFKKALAVVGYDNVQFQEALGVYRQYKSVEEFVDLLTIAQLHCPVGGAYNTIPKSRMLQKLMTFWRLKRDEWERELTNEYGAPGGAELNNDDLREEQMHAQQHIPLAQPDVDHRARYELARQQESGDNEPLMLHAEAVAVTETRSLPTQTISPKEQIEMRPAQTRSVAWSNGLMAGLAQITLPFVYSMAAKLDRDSIEAMAESLLSFKDVVTYCSKLVEAYEKADAKDVRLTKHIGLSMSLCVIICRPMSPRVALCHHMSPCVVTGIICAIGTVAEKNPKKIALEHELMGLSPLVHVLPSTCLYDRKLFPLVKGEPDVGMGLFAREDVPSGTYYIVAHMQSIVQATDPDKIPFIKRKHALMVSQRNNKAPLWIYPR